MLTPKCTPKTPETLSTQVNPTIFGDSNKVWQKTLAEYLPKTGLDVLDVGTGTSKVAKTMESANTKLRVLTCDTNPSAKVAFNHIAGAFDVVTAFDVIDYDPEWRTTLQAIRDSSKRYVAIKGGNYLKGLNKDPYKVLELTPNELVLIARSYGLKFVKGWEKESYGKLPFGLPSEIHFRATQAAEYMALFEVA